LVPAKVVNAVAWLDMTTLERFDSAAGDFVPLGIVIPTGWWFQEKGVVLGGVLLCAMRARVLARVALLHQDIVVVVAGTRNKEQGTEGLSRQPKSKCNAKSRPGRQAILGNWKL